jgi:hypothetical protein
MYTKLLTAAFVAASATACHSEPSISFDESQEGDDAVAQQLSALHGLSGHLVEPNSGLVRAIYQHESKRWIRWALGLPWSTGPVTDETGASCTQGQVGPVWFLAGTGGGSVTRSCTIPKNKVLFFPLHNRWANPRAEFVDEPAELAEYQLFLDEYFPALRTSTCQLKLLLDGVPLLPTLEALDGLWTENRHPFSVTLQDDNYAADFGFTAGVYPAATQAGHYALLLPLSPGAHTLEFGGATCFEDGTIEFEVSATYNLTVRR